MTSTPISLARSALTYGSNAITRIPNPAARAATSEPTRPRPTKPDRLAGELDPLPPRPLPPAVDQVGVRLRDVAGLREQQREGVLGRADDVGLRGVDDHHATARRRLDVDVVQADPGAGDHLQALAALEHVGGHPGGAADDRARRTGAIAAARSPFAQLGPHVDLEVLAGATPGPARRGSR